MAIKVSESHEFLQDIDKNKPFSSIALDVLNDYINYNEEIKDDNRRKLTFKEFLVLSPYSISADTNKIISTVKVLAQYFN